MEGQEVDVVKFAVLIVKLVVIVAFQTLTPVTSPLVVPVMVKSIFNMGSVKHKAAEQSVHPTLGILRQSQAVFYTLSFFQLDGFADPAPARVTQTVSAPSEAWRFLQSASLCRTRSNQPFVPSVAVMKEKAKTGWRYTIVRENLGIEEGTTATSMSLKTGTR